MLYSPCFENKVEAIGRVKHISDGIKSKYRSKGHTYSHSDNDTKWDIKNKKGECVTKPSIASKMYVNMFNLANSHILGI